MEDDEDDLLQRSIHEITDFTNATPWESFITDVENVLHQWGLAPSEHEEESTLALRQHRKSERIKYAGRTFVMTLDLCGAAVKRPTEEVEKDWPLAFHEMMDTSLDFPPKAHHLSRWYGVTEFIVLAPEEGSDALTSQAQANFMLSTMSIAITNTGCETPVFIQVQQNWRQMYVGLCQGRSVRSNLDMVHLRHTPPQYSHLAGLLDIFKDKLRCAVQKMEPINIAVRFTYVLKHWSLDEWPVEPIGSDEEQLGVSLQAMLPVGALSDPVQELHLSAVWPNLTEEFVVHNSAHSDLDPTNAPVWTIRLQLAKQGSSLLAEHLACFVKLSHTREGFSELVGHDEDSGSEPPDFTAALSRLTDPTVAGSQAVLSAAMSYSSSQRVELAGKREAVVESELEEVVRYLFPGNTSSAGQMADNSSSVASKVDVQQIKAAPGDSFTFMLVKALCIVNYRFGIEAFSKVWKMILTKLRFCWEKGVSLSYLGNGPPDMGSSLLHQKLQMLNCCIRHKVTRQKSNGPTAQATTTTITPATSTTSTSTSTTASATKPVAPLASNSVSLASVRKSSVADSGESEEDEFYEALESQDSDHRAPPNPSPLPSHSSPRKSGKVTAVEEMVGGSDPLTVLSYNEEEEGGSSKQRVGALKPCGDLLLLATGEPLYIPVTQEQPPMTEDMMWEQQGVLARLGTSEEAAKVRAKMQSLSLVSDMQAFKAANPGCLLEDFVRWYSPRDWVEEEEKEEEGDRVTKPLSKSSEQSSHQRDPLASLTTSERLGDWGDEAEDWDVILGGAQTQTKDEVQAGSEVKVEQATSKEVPGLSASKRYAKGCLSRRMQQTDNIWIESWNLATPLPACKQKRLFDDTREAEKVLHYFEKIQPNELALAMLPVLLSLAIRGLLAKLDHQPLARVIGLLQDVTSLLSTIHNPSLEAVPKFQECASLLSQAELLLSAAHSLRIKLQRGLEIMSGVGAEGSVVAPQEKDRKEVDVGVEMLVESPELSIRDPAHSMVGLALQGLMATQTEEGPNNIFPPETGKEFILRCTTPRPGATSRPCPQRMFCVLTKDQFRLAGAFSNDITSS